MHDSGQQPYASLDGKSITRATNDHVRSVRSVVYNAPVCRFDVVVVLVVVVDTVVWIVVECTWVVRDAVVTVVAEVVPGVVLEFFGTRMTNFNISERVRMTAARIRTDMKMSLVLRCCHHRYLSIVLTVFSLNVGLYLMLLSSKKGYSNEVPFCCSHHRH